MSTQALKTAATGTAVGEAKQSLPALLQKMKPQLALALPKHMNADRMLRIALTELRKNPKLMTCEQNSVLAAVVIGSQLGLEPGINGQAFLIPYEDKRKGITVCNFVPGWKGLVDLAQRSGRSTVWTGAVYEGDEFEYEYGTKPYLKHKQSETFVLKAKQTHAYAVGWVRGAEYPVLEVWPMGKVWAHRDHYNKVGQRHYSYDNPEMYSRKVALLQVLKYMPQSIELSTAMDLDSAAEMGRQGLDLNDAMEGSFVPVPEEGAEPPTTTTDAPAGEATTQEKPIEEPDAITLFRAAKTVEEIQTIWTRIVAIYVPNSVPLPIEAARNTFRDMLIQKAAGK